MILPFSKYWDKHPTFFAEKIWASLIGDYTANEFAVLLGNYGLSENDIAFKRPKIHTIRRDVKNRWKTGNKIHCVYNNRTKNQYQFAPTLNCYSTQSIYIYSSENCSGGIKTEVQIGDRLLASEEIKELAINDGFDSVSDFLKYFRTDFSGKIIHWTEKRYKSWK